VTLALGIFDVFTYAIPGSLYLTLLVYVAARAGWLPLDAAGGFDTSVLLIGVALASYLLGHVTYRLGSLLNRLVPPRDHLRAGAAREFTDRVPGAKARRLASVDPQLLLAAVEARSKDVAVEISRLRAVGLMLQNAAPALLLGGLVAVVELAAGPRPPAAACCAALLFAGALAAVRRGRTLRRWSLMKTYELAFWVTGPDAADADLAGDAAADRTAAEQAAGQPAGQPPA